MERKNNGIYCNTKLEKHGAKENYKYLGILEADNIKQVEMEKKTPPPKKKNPSPHPQKVPLKNKKTSGNQAEQQKSHQMNKHLDSSPPPWKILGTILKMDTGRTHIIVFLPFLFIFTNPSARAGYDTRSIFKRTNYNSQCHANEPVDKKINDDAQGLT